MKVLCTLFLSLVFATSAFAATSKQINTKAENLLMSNLANLTINSDSELTSSDVFSHLVYKHTKVSTRCTYNRADALYNCTTTAINGIDEFAMFIKYQLEGKRGKLPTGFFFMSVTVDVAG